MQYHNQIDEPFVITDEATVYGMITKMTTVSAGGTLKLHGMITSDLLVEKGGTALIFGIVDGLIVNKGEVTIYGTVGRIITEPNANTNIQPNAVVRHT